MNLLPEEDQKKISSERILRLAEFVGLGLFMLILIAVILLFAAYLFLALQSDDLKRQLEIEKRSSELKRAEALDQAIRDLNIHSRSLIDNEKSIHNPFNEFGVLLAKKPYGIYVVSVGYNRGGGKIGSTLTVNGHANTRVNLLKYVDLLEKSEKFARVNSPVSNLLSREELQFTLVLDLKP